MPTIDKLLTGRPALTLPKTATVLEAARAMERDQVGCVLVVDAEGRPEGIFTERDLMIRIVCAGRDPGGVTLDEAMTADMFTAAPSKPISEVRAQLQKRHIRHVPIIAEGRVLGVLSLRDLLRHDLEQRADEVRQLTDYIQGDAPA